MSARDICFRCPAFDNKRECGINMSLLSKQRLQGFECKKQRYEYNQMRQKLLDLI